MLLAMLLHAPECRGLAGEHEERQAPGMQAGKDAADQGTQKRTRPPDEGDDAEQAAPPSLLEPFLNREIAQGE
jgi:hypothetical protein